MSRPMSRDADELMSLAPARMPTADELAKVGEFARQAAEAMTAIGRSILAFGAALGSIVGGRDRMFWGADAPVVLHGEDDAIEIVGPTFGPHPVPLAYVHRGTIFSPHRDVAGCRVVGENGACVDTFVTLEAWLNMPAGLKREARWLRDVERLPGQCRAL